MGFNKRPLSAGEIRKLRAGVNEELAGYVLPAPVEVDDLDYDGLPEKTAQDKDLLTPRNVRAICEDMAKNHVSVFIAGRAIGLPEKVIAAYLERGNDDLANGELGTRMAWFAVFVNRAEGRVQRSLVGSVIANPLGWLNTAHLLDHLWPESFAVQRLSQKVQAPNALNEQLRKQLDDAREGKGGASLPLLDDVMDVGTQKD